MLRIWPGRAERVYVRATEAILLNVHASNEPPNDRSRSSRWYCVLGAWLSVTLKG